jgi:hypothetical protein
MKRLIISILFLLFCIPINSKAAAYWMEVIGSGKLSEPVRIQICYGNIDDYSIRHRDTGKELKLTGAFKINVVDDAGKSTPLTLNPQADCWEAEFTPGHEGIYQILAVNDSHPVVDRSKTGGKNVRPVDFLCSAYEVGKGGIAVTKPAQLLDIIAACKNDVVVIHAFNNDAPVAVGTKLRVFNPENWEKELTVNEKGETFFKTTMKGLYIIREDWDDQKPGTYQGVNYSSTRYRCNYCLEVR